VQKSQEKGLLLGGWEVGSKYKEHQDYQKILSLQLLHCQNLTWIMKKNKIELVNKKWIRADLFHVDELLKTTPTDGLNLVILLMTEIRPI